MSKAGLSYRYLETNNGSLNRYIDYIVALLSAVIFTTWHAILTSLVVSNYDEVDLKFSYVFGVEWLAFVPLGIAMLLIIWVGRVKPNLFLELSKEVFFKHLVFAIILFVIHSIWQQYINATFLSSVFTYQGIERDFVTFLEMRYLAYIIMIGLVGGMIKLKEHEKVTLRESNLKLELQRAQLRELELKMNPEIIYPTLDYIRKNTRDSPEKASQMVILLAGLLRKLVDNLEGDLIVISDDVQLFSLYRDMLQLRKEKSIYFEKKVDKKALNKRIPPIILLIPLIENLFFGKYEPHFKDVNKMSYKVISTRDSVSCIEVSFQPVIQERNLDRNLEEEPYIKKINTLFNNSIENEFLARFKLENHIFKLCLEQSINKEKK